MLRGDSLSRASPAQVCEYMITGVLACCVLLTRHEVRSAEAEGHCRAERATGALIEEWTGIIERAAPCARVLLRSAHARPPFLEWVRVGRHGRSLHEVIEFDRDLAARLQREDRVHTYSGFLVGTILK